MKRFSRRSLLQTLTAATGATVFADVRSSAQDRPHDVPWLAEVQQPPAKLPADAPKLSDLLIDASGNRITTVEQWKMRREELRRWWLDFLGPLPAERKAAPKLMVVEEDHVDGVIRQLVRYEIEPGLMTEA